MTDTADSVGEGVGDAVAHLQRAAKELIAAGRAFLDAAEDLVDDPASMGQIGDALGTLAKLAGSALSTAGRVVPGAFTDDHVHDHDVDHDHDERRVQRIRVQ
jgi:hypothetical protein